MKRRRNSPLRTTLDRMLIRKHIQDKAAPFYRRAAFWGTVISGAMLLVTIGSLAFTIRLSHVTLILEKNELENARLELKRTELNHTNDSLQALIRNANELLTSAEGKSLAVAGELIRVKQVCAKRQHELLARIDQARMSTRFYTDTVKLIALYAENNYLKDALKVRTESPEHYGEWQHLNSGSHLMNANERMQCYFTERALEECRQLVVAASLEKMADTR